MTHETQWLSLPHYSKYEINRKLQLRHADSKKPVEIDPNSYGFSWKLEGDSGNDTRFSFDDLLLYYGYLFDWDIDTSDWNEDDEYEFRQPLVRNQTWHRLVKSAKPQPNYDFLSAEELINGDYYLIGDMYMLLEETYFYNYDEDFERKELLPSLVVFSTGGDGGFEDQHGKYYMVEGGNFGIVKASDIDRKQLEDILQCFIRFSKRREDSTQDLGHIAKLENGNVYADENGHIWFGNHEVVIDGNCMWDTTTNVGVGEVTGVD